MTKRVLLCDDDCPILRAAEFKISRAGYEVRCAGDGQAAWEMIQQWLPDILVTDLQMPRLDGFGLLAEIKKNKRLASLPVILVTSLDKREDQERGLSLGADAYIVKRKFDHEDLLNTIRQIL